MMAGEMAGLSFFPLRGDVDACAFLASNAAIAQSVVGAISDVASLQPGGASGVVSIER